jgi:hypothetical protein
MSKAVLWKVEGDYFEGCNCQSTCPCTFLADPTEGNCKLAIGWHIQKGQYGSIQLDGLNVTGIYYAPGNMVTGPKWKAALYLDGQATKEQADALRQIFSGQVGGFMATLAPLIGENLGVRNAQIQFGAEGKRRWMNIPNILEIEIQGVKGGNPDREATVTNPALYGGVPFDPVISRSAKYTYNDYGLKWDNTGKNGFYSRFTYVSSKD